ncbi:MAG: hypothetical protein ACXWJ4_07985 [Methyloceanibacter sp.]
MTRSNPPNFSRQILLLAASIFLLAAPQGALAKHKDHSDDHSGMSSNDSNDDHGDEHSEDHKAPVSTNTIHPIASPPPRVVTISVGGGSFQMYDGPGGMTVTSHHPGQLTISNGVQTQTLSGIKVTISGSAGVGVARPWSRTS